MEGGRVLGKPGGGASDAAEASGGSAAFPPAPAKIPDFGYGQKWKTLQQKVFAQGEWKTIFILSMRSPADGRLAVTCSFFPLLRRTGEPKMNSSLSGRWLKAGLKWGLLWFGLEHRGHPSTQPCSSCGWLLEERFLCWIPPCKVCTLRFFTGSGALQHRRSWDLLHQGGGGSAPSWTCRILAKEMVLDHGAGPTHWPFCTLELLSASVLPSRWGGGERVPGWQVPSAHPSVLGWPRPLPWARPGAGQCPKRSPRGCRAECWGQEGEPHFQLSLELCHLPGLICERTAQQWELVPEERAGLEGHTVQLQKGWSWLVAGMPEPAACPAREWGFPWGQEQKQSPALSCSPPPCPAPPSLGWERSGATFGQQSWGRDGPIARVRCPMQPLRAGC